MIVKSVNTSCVYQKDVNHLVRQKRNCNIASILVISALILGGFISGPALVQAKSMPNFGSSNLGATANSIQSFQSTQLPQSGLGTPIAQPLLILQSTAYKDSTGAINIVGELQNQFPFTVSSIRISGTVLGSNSLVAGSSPLSFADIDQLRPGEKSGFHIILANAPSGGKQYQLSTSYVQVSSPKPSSLNVILGQPYTDSSGLYHVTGQVVNQGSQLTRAVKVSAVFYDAKGKIVDDKSIYTTPTDLDPGIPVTFDISPSSPIAKDAKFSSVNVQSEEYASLTMNPSTLQQPLLGLQSYKVNSANEDKTSHHHNTHCIGNHCSNCGNDCSNCGNDCQKKKNAATTSTKKNATTTS
jgi:hypothetical protein